MPQSLFVINALLANNVALFTAVNAVFPGVVALGTSFLLNAGVALLSSTGARQQDIRRSLARQTELPQKRFVYGHGFAVGTPLPRLTEGGFVYQCFLLNSRTSEGNFELYLDDRVVTLTGDAYDLTGAGATATNGLLDGHVTVWFAKGDQTAPPATFTSEVPYHATNRPLGYNTTDAGQGLTLCWLKCKRGDQGEIEKRWPSYPGFTVKVKGDWSKVGDPRTHATGWTTESNHSFSKNQALCLLDLLSSNPFRANREEDFDIDTWKEGADVADETVDRLNGGSEARYEVAGTVIFNGSEIEQLTEPLELAGASSVSRSGGRYAFVPGAARDSAVTITETQGLPKISLVRPPEEQFDVVHCSYAPIDRDGEPASLPPWDIPGVTAFGQPRILSLDLAMVSSDGQAQRVRKIKGLETTYKKTMSLVAFAGAMKATAGSWVTTDLEYSQMDGTFEVVSCNPLAYPTEERDGGCALRVPMQVIERADAIYAWDKSEEVTMDHPPLVYDEEGVQQPGAISATTGDSVNQNTGGTIIPRILLTFDPSTTSGVDTYEYQLALSTESYSSSGSVDGGARDSNGDVFFYVSGSPDETYKARVRARTLSAYSDWVEITGISPQVNLNLDVPVIGTITEPSSGTVRVPVTVPNDSDVTGVEVYAGSDSDSGNASALGSRVYASQNTVVNFDETGLGSAVTRYYFTRSLGDYGAVSAFSAATSFTTA